MEITEADFFTLGLECEDGKPPQDPTYKPRRVKLRWDPSSDDQIYTNDNVCEWTASRAWGTVARMVLLIGEDEFFKLELGYRQPVSAAGVTISAFPRSLKLPRNDLMTKYGDVEIPVMVPVVRKLLQDTFIDDPEPYFRAEFLSWPKRGLPRTKNVALSPSEAWNAAIREQSQPGWKPSQPTKDDLLRQLSCQWKPEKFDKPDGSELGREIIYSGALVGPSPLDGIGRIFKERYGQYTTRVHIPPALPNAMQVGSKDITFNPGSGHDFQFGWSDSWDDPGQAESIDPPQPSKRCKPVIVKPEGRIIVPSYWKQLERAAQAEKREASATMPEVDPTPAGAEELIDWLRADESRGWASKLSIPKVTRFLKERASFGKSWSEHDFRVLAGE